MSLVHNRGLQFEAFWGISLGIKQKMIDIGKKVTFLLYKILENVQFFAFAF
jgi:hypothetical protein